MAKTIETVATINSAVRTVLALVVCGAAGTGGWYAYTTYNAKDIAAREAAKKLQDTEDLLVKTKSDLQARELEIHKQAAKIAEQVAELKKKDEQIAKLETARRLLKVDHRLAQINILDQTTDEKGEITSTVQFVELNPEGMPLGEPKKPFVLKGDMIYIDGLSVTFEDKYVEQADLDRGTSLFSFTRIFTDIQNPKDGYPLDDVGSRPLAYGKGGQMSEFESNIWKNFWSLANDKEAAEKMGIANIHGSAVSIKPVKGNSYTIELRASAGPKLKYEGKIPGDVR
jgi:hypothetical protein